MQGRGGLVEVAEKESLEEEVGWREHDNEVGVVGPEALHSSFDDD